MPLRAPSGTHRDAPAETEPTVPRPVRAPGTTASVRRIAISSGTQIGGTIASGLTTIVVLRLLLSRLGPDDYGRYVILVAFVSAACLITDMGLNGVSYREVARSPERTEEIIGINLGLRCALSLVAIPVIVGLIFILYPHDRGALMAAAAILSVDVLLTVIQATVSLYFGAQVRGEYNALLVVTGRLIFLGGIFVVTRQRWGLEGAVSAYVAADFVSMALAIALASRYIRIRPVFSARAWWQTAVQAIPVSTLQLLTALYMYVDSVILSLVSTNRQVAYYGLGFNMVSLAATFCASFASSLVPRISVSDAHSVRQIVERGLYVATCIAAPLAVAGAVLAGPLVAVLGGSEFAKARVPLALLCLSLLFTYPTTILSYAAISTGRLRRLLMVNAVILLLNIVLNTVLSRTYGAVGASASLLSCEALSLVGTFYFFGRSTAMFPRLKGLWKPVFAGIGMAVTGIAVDHFNTSAAILVLVEGAAAMIVVFIGALLIVRGVPAELKQVLERSKGSVASTN